MRIRPQAALQRHRFEMIKEAVSVATLARDLIEDASGRVRESSGELRGYCPICGHGNHSEAFSAQAKPAGILWHCHACGEGGDVIELAQLAGGFQYASEAVAWLGWRYGIELPERPESWYRKQSRQEKLRERIEGERRELKRRRLFRLFVLPELEKVSEPDRARETRIAWDSFQKLPLP